MKKFLAQALSSTKTGVFFNGIIEKIDLQKK
jgi:hypothetical protein